MAEMDTRAIQRRLRDAGFDPGQIDGVVGPKTRAAIREFQRARGLSVDGVAGPRTQAALTGMQREEARPSRAPDRAVRTPTRATTAAPARGRPVTPPSRPTRAPDRAVKPASRPTGFASPTSTRVETPAVTTSRIDAAGTQDIRRRAEAALAQAESQARRRQIVQMRDRILEEATRVPKPNEERVPGRALLRAFQNFLDGKGPTDPTAVMREARGYKAGGVVNKAKK